MALRPGSGKPGLSQPTIEDHVDNMRFFSRYLVLYAYSLRRLDEAHREVGLLTFQRIGSRAKRCGPPFPA